MASKAAYSGSKRRGQRRWKTSKVPAPRGRSQASVVRWLRHPLRVLVMAVAALCVAWGITGPVGNVMAVLGAVAGVIGGELLARSRMRLGAVALAVAGGALIAGTLAWGLSSSELVAGTIGTGATLTLGVMLRFFVWSTLAVGVLRVAAARFRALVALELAAVVAAVSWLFAAHRDGVIERPHWLSDWAWRASVDPTDVLIGVGAGSVVILALLMVADTGRRSSFLTALVVPVLALLAVVLFDVSVLPRPRPANDLGLTQTSEGDESKQTKGGEPVPKGGQGDEQGDKQGGQGDKQGDKQGEQQGGQGDEQGEQQGGQGDEQGEQQGGQGDEQGEQQGGQGEQQGEQQGGQGEQQGEQSQDQQGQGQQPQEPNMDDPPPSPQSKQAPMAVVLLRDDYSPPSQMYYFRQEVWSHYTGSRMVAPRRSDVDRDVLTEYPSLTTDVPNPPPEQGRVLLSADVSMLVEHKKPFFLEAPVRYIPKRNANPQRFVRAYRFESRSQIIDYRQLVGRQAGNPAWSEVQRDYYLVGPTDPRYAALAEQIISKLSPAQRQDPFLKALAIKVHFDQTLTYSTKHRHAGVADPTADFLFGDKIGYCVHFAHAAVYLWRSLGIPSRIGTGYATTEDDRLGATIVIQSGDAHSWPELYLDGIGWIVLDISAQQNLDPPTPPPDEESMRKLADMAREEPPEPEEEPALEEDEGASQASGATIALALLVLALAVVLGLYLTKIWRRLVPWLASERAQPRVSFRLALDLLSEAGMARRYGETRTRFAERVADRVPCFHRLTEMNLAARFGDPKVPIAERDEHGKQAWRSSLKQLRRELSGRTKRWRRLLGLLDPASFFASR